MNKNKKFIYIEPLNKNRFTINNLVHCCEAIIFTHPLVYRFMCGLIFMAHPVE